MKEVFLAFAFNDEDRELANQVEQLVGSHDVMVRTGKSVGGQALTPAVKDLIDKTEGLIALLTRRDKIPNKRNKYTTHPWVRDELNHAREKHKNRTIALGERGVEVGGMYGENEYIPFDRKNSLPAFLQLSETVGRWKREVGRTIEALILPEDLGVKLFQGTIKIRYRLIPKIGKAADWEEAEPVTKIGGTIVHLWGVKEEDTIQLEVTLDQKKWQSIAAPQWVKIELNPM